MRKTMKNLLAVLLIILIMLSVILSNKNISKATAVGHIDVEMLENGQQVEDKLKLATNGKGNIKVGKKYKEELQAHNTGSVDMYVRAIVTKDWRDEKGIGVTDDSLLDLLLDSVKLNILENNGWFIDKDACTPERTVVYYEKPLPVGETTPPFMDSFTIDANLKNEYEVIKNGNNVQIVGKYDGYQFEIEVDVNAVQTHSAEDAIKAAWGLDVSVDSNGIITIL